MRKTLLWSVLTVSLIACAVLVWKRNGAATEAAPAANPEQPVAQVRSEIAQVRVLDQTLEAFGEISSAQLQGVSFARAGQLTRLSVVAGDRVAQGVTLATLSADPASREAYSQAANAAASSRREEARVRELLGLQLATQSQLDAATKAAKDADGALAALNAQGGGSPSSEIRAPFDALVVSVAVAQGDRIQAGAPIMQLARADALRVQIGIEPVNSRVVMVGTKVSLILATASLDARGTRSDAINAEISSIQNVVDAKTQLVSAVVLLPRSATRQLVPGMKVRASLLIGSQSSISVPRDAVLTDSQGDYVFQVDAGKARRATVTKGIESRGYVGVSGLANPALRVVSVGNYELQDGMSVKEITR